MTKQPEHIDRIIQEAKDVAIQLGVTFQNEATERVFDSLLNRIAASSFDFARSQMLDLVVDCSNYFTHKQ